MSVQRDNTGMGKATPLKSHGTDKTQTVVIMQKYAILIL